MIKLKGVDEFRLKKLDSSRLGVLFELEKSIAR